MKPTKPLLSARDINRITSRLLIAMFSEWTPDSARLVSDVIRQEIDRIVKRQKGKK
jgi:hypothetical protein